MPVHDAARTLSASIESVLAQRDPDWELHLVDDASTDESAAIIERFTAHDERIRAHRSATSVGAGAARNLGIGAASGRFVAFLDADDLWHPRKLEVQIPAMIAAGAPLSYTAYAKIDFETTDTDVPGAFSRRVVLVPPQLTYSDMLRQNYIGCLTAVYDRSLVGTVFMPELRMRQDYGMWLKILRNGATAHGVAEPLALYRESRRGSLSSNKLKGARYTWRVYRELEHLPLATAVRSFASYAVLSTRKRAI